MSSKGSARGRRQPAREPGLPPGLELLDAVELPPARFRLPTIRCRLGPNRRFFGVLAYRVLLRVYEAQGNHLREVYSYPIPPTATDFALDPAGERLALATRHQIQVIHYPSDSVTLRSVESDWGEVRALLFSLDGRVVWASLENAAGLHRLFALDSATLRPLGDAPLAGAPDAHHLLFHHPTEEIVGAEVSCGQDGTWVTFAELTGGTVQLRPPGLACEYVPLAVAGFPLAGDSWLALGEQQLQCFSWPAGKPLASYGPAAGWQLTWQAALSGDLLLVPVTDRDEERFELHILSGRDLRLLNKLSWESADQSYLLSMHGLRDDLLLIVGDRRIGLFRCR